MFVLGMAIIRRKLHVLILAWQMSVSALKDYNSLNRRYFSNSEKFSGK